MIVTLLAYVLAILTRNYNIKYNPYYKKALAIGGRSTCQILLRRRNVTRKLTLNQYKCHPLLNLVKTEIN